MANPIFSFSLNSVEILWANTDWYVLAFWMKNPGETWLKAPKGEDQSMAQFWLVSATSLNNEVHN